MYAIFVDVHHHCLVILSCIIKILVFNAFIKINAYYVTDVLPHCTVHGDRFAVICLFSCFTLGQAQWDRRNINNIYY